MPLRALLYPPLILITLLVHGRIVTHDFVGWDDPMTLFENPRMLPPTANTLTHYWSSSEHGLWVPMTYTVWSGLAAIAHTRSADGAVVLNPAIFHASSVMIHVISTLACFEILQLLLQHRRASLLGAILYAVHPMQVEPVAWASGTKDLLAGCFSLLATWQYLLFARGTRRLRTHYALSIVFLLVALLSKPSAVVAPVIMGLLDVLVLRRPIRQGAIALAPMLVLIIPFIVIGRMAQHQVVVTTAPLWTRPLVALDAIAFYLYKLAFPLTLTPIYGRSPDYVYQGGQLLWTWLLPVMLALVLLRFRQRVLVLVAAAGVLLVAVSPVLGLTPFMFQGISTVSDHYMYLAMLGPALALAWVIARWPSRITYTTAAALLVLLAVRSALQAGVWRDSEALFAHAVRARPDNDVAQAGYGNVLARQGNYEQALRRFLIAVNIEPRNSLAQSRLAMAYLELGRPELAIEPILRAIDIIETHPAQLEDARREHVLAALALSRVGRYSEALHHLAAADADPRDPAAAEAMQRVAAAIRRGELQPPGSEP